MVTLADLETPALLLEEHKFRANCERMIQRCRARGTRLRPHMKTLKSAEAARIALDPQHGGIAVSTLNEAEYFAANGFADLQLAVCLPPTKLDRAARVLEQADHFSFFVDDVATACAVAAHGAPFRVWIELDCGEHRTGVRDRQQLIQVAEALGTRSSVVLAGVATHAGQSYRARDIEEIAWIAEHERHSVVRAAETLRAKGFPVPGVSAGSTPTAMFGGSAAELTEVRAGVYMAGDLFQAGIGATSRDDIAVSVLSTVIGRSSSHLVIDAGGLALSKDVSTEPVLGCRCYGIVCDEQGTPISDLVVAQTHQEHGEIPLVDEALAERISVGTRLRIVPNHICMTAAMYPAIHVVSDIRVVAEWKKTNGWGAGCKKP